MSDSADQPSSTVTRVVLLGDCETVEHRADLDVDAAKRGCRIIDAFGFEDGAAAGTDDLTEITAVVAALGRAITGRMDVWVPFPGPDFTREQHLRRMSLVLQRHGLNLRLTRNLYSAPTDGGMNEIDFALRRRSTRSTTSIRPHWPPRAPRASAVRSSWRWVPPVARRPCAWCRRGRPAQSAPAAADAAVAVDAVAGTQTAAGELRALAGRRVRRHPGRDGADPQLGGQRTATGRPWKPGSVSRLLNGKYGGPRRPEDVTPDAVAG